MKLITILIATLVLSACASQEIVYKPIPVNVPVEVPCHVPEIVPPVWPTASITAQTPFFQQVQAVLAELKLRQGFEGSLTAALGACK